MIVNISILITIQNSQLSTLVTPQSLLKWSNYKMIKFTKDFTLVN